MVENLQVRNGSSMVSSTIFIDLESVLYIAFLCENRKKIDIKTVVEFAENLQKELSRQDENIEYIVDADPKGIKRFVEFYSSTFDLIGNQKTIVLINGVTKNDLYKKLSEILPDDLIEKIKKIKNI